MDIVISLTDQELAALTTEIAAMAAPQPTVEEYLTTALRNQTLTPVVRRQAQYRIGRVIARLNAAGLVEKLAALQPADQDEIQALVESEVDKKLGVTAEVAAEDLQP